MYADFEIEVLTLSLFLCADGCLGAFQKTMATGGYFNFKADCQQLFALLFY